MRGLTAFLTKPTLLGSIMKGRKGNRERGDKNNPAYWRMANLLTEEKDDGFLQLARPRRTGLSDPLALEPLVVWHRACPVHGGNLDHSPEREDNLFCPLGQTRKRGRWVVGHWIREWAVEKG